MTRENERVRVVRAEDGREHPPAEPVENGIEVMWQLTLDAWAFQEDFDAESRLPRHVVRVVRGQS